MGKGYSKEEIIEFEKYKKNLENAIDDQSPYLTYKRVKRELS